MSNPCITIMDIQYICLDCGYLGKGFIRWNDKIKDIKCQICNKQNLTMMYQSKPYDIPC
jgi:hypothetical protein